MWDTGLQGAVGHPLHGQQATHIHLIERKKKTPLHVGYESRHLKSLQKVTGSTILIAKVLALFLELLPALSIVQAKLKGGRGVAWRTLHVFSWKSTKFSFPCQVSVTHFLLFLVLHQEVD